jgi:histidinol-phosphate/aromatic aminotransferase/cobyric acid decarboxylase-like protein
LQTSFPLASFLETWGIGIRSFPNNYYRITIPSDTELKSLEKAIKEIDDENKR